MVMQNNPFAGFLEDVPESAYFSFANQWRTPNMRRYFQNQFSNIQNQYMGALGSQIRGGGEPTLGFADFLSQLPWEQQYRQQNPGAFSSSRFSPWARWMV